MQSQITSKSNAAEKLLTLHRGQSFQTFEAFREHFSRYAKTNFVHYHALVKNKNEDPLAINFPYEKVLYVCINCGEPPAGCQSLVSCVLIRCSMTYCVDVCKLKHNHPTDAAYYRAVGKDRPSAKKEVGPLQFKSSETHDSPVLEADCFAANPAGSHPPPGCRYSSSAPDRRVPPPPA